MQQKESSCLICKKHADQTGSHIFSWFLIRDAINKAGLSVRDNEIVFSISEREYVRAYFGKDQSSPDAVIRIRGYELTDEEIEQTKISDPFKRDFILCRNCEKRLQVLENVVNDTVIVKLRKHKVQKATGVDFVDIQETELLRLFIYSLLLRGSATRIGDFEMTEAHQETLRQILNENLDRSKDELISNILKNSDTIKHLPIIVIFCETIGNNDNYIYCSRNFKPYAMIINDLSFQVYFPDAINNGFDISLFGINNIISKRRLLNKNEKQLTIGILSNKHRLQVNQNLSIVLGSSMLASAIEVFNTGYRKIFQANPSKALLEIYKNRIFSEKIKFKEHFTIKHFIVIAAKLLAEVAHSSDINQIS